MVSRKWSKVMGGGLLVALPLYLRYLFSIKLDTPKKTAVYNGFNLLNQSGRVLAVTAHPDDLEFFMGGTLNQLKGRNREIHVIDVTDGEKGVKRHNLRQTRIKEQRKAAEVLGITQVHFLHLPDMSLQEVPALYQRLRQEIIAINPDIVFAFDYQFPFRAIIHPDHIAVGRNVAAIVRREIPRCALVFYATRKPNTVVDIAGDLTRKIESVKKHRSQLRFSSRPYGWLVKAMDRYNSRKTAGNYVEIFRISLPRK